jgi:hypothetical protein
LFIDIWLNRFEPTKPMTPNFRLLLDPTPVLIDQQLMASGRCMLKRLAKLNRDQSTLHCF